MQKNSIKKSLSLALSIMLIAASAAFTTGCSNDKTSADTQAETTVASSEAVEASAVEGAETTAASSEAGDVSVIGEGETSFDFIVTDKDGNESRFEVHTDKTTVGAALLDAGIIEGEESEYGLYVKTVNGITADFDTDGVYWAFYIDGEYASTGVDSTDITPGSVYSFKVE